MTWSSALGNPNVYDRDIAQQLLTERTSPAAPAGAHRVSSPSTPRSRAPLRMHALWVAVGSGPLDAGFHAKLLRNATMRRIRAWGVRAAGNQR